MVAQGILHLLTGFDHLAFLLVALLAVVRKRDGKDLRPLRTAMVESFKVDHRVHGGAFDHARSVGDGRRDAGSEPVEASIAATVAITAISGFWKPTRFHGWPLAAAFGLVHGFGFAGALSELIGGNAHAAAIGSFNLGIEIAQIAVALRSCPLLYLLTRRQSMERFVAPAISGVVAVAGSRLVRQNAWSRADKITLLRSMPSRRMN